MESFHVLFLMVACLSVLNPAEAQDECINGEETASGECRVASRGYNGYYEAFKQCETYGCILDVPMTADEATKLFDYAQSKGIVNDLWIGGHDFCSEGTYVEAGTGLNLTYTNWYDGEPNGGFGENCILIDSTSLRKYRDANCDSGKRFICRCPKGSSVSQPL